MLRAGHFQAQLNPIAMSHVSIRPARPNDCGEFARLRHPLWPESSAEEHAQALAGWPGGKPPELAGRRSSKGPV
jgi:hypothetical protein